MEGDLNPLLLAEIRKAFAVCDKDGNGVIDSQELRDVVVLITDREPSKSELQKLMFTMDKNQDGKIEWSEFVSVMSNWLQEDGKKSTSVTGKRKNHPESERQSVHKKIKNFFEQFQETSVVDIRKRISSFYSLDEISMFSFIGADGLIVEARTPEAKVKFLYDYRNSISRFNEILKYINSTFPSQQLEPLQALSKLLSIVEIFPTPIERRAIAEEVTLIFEYIAQYNLVPLLLKFALQSNEPKIQWGALKSLTYIAPGPRIASTPENSNIHPAQMYFKKLILHANGAHTLLTLLFSPVREVREQCVLTIGSLIAHNPEIRDFFLKYGTLQPLLNLLDSDAQSISMVRKLSSTLAIFCGVTHSWQQLPPWPLVSPCLKPLGLLLWTNDEEILVNILPALSLILPGIPELAVCRRLVELLVASPLRVQRAALKTITCIIRFDNCQMGYFFTNCSLLSFLPNLLNSDDDEIRMDTAELILVIAGLKQEIQALLQAGVGKILIERLSADDYIRPKMIKILKYMTRGNFLQLKYLIEHGIISSFSKCLTYFKTYDRVLGNVYKYSGLTYNFELARDILVGLDNIINLGEMIIENTNNTNPFAMHFDSECVDQLRWLLSTIKENPHQEEINAWRQERPGDIGLEERIFTLLFKIQRVRSRSLDNQSRYVLSMIEETLNKFSNHTTPSTIVIKAYLENDIRIITVPLTLPIADLKRGLEVQYGKRIKSITYLDKDNEHVTLDSQSSLETAFRMAQEHTVKLFLIAEASSSVLDSTLNGPYLSRDKKFLSNSSTRENLLISSSINDKLFTEGPDSKPILVEQVPPLSFSLEEIKLKQKKPLLEQLGSHHFGPKELEILHSRWKANEKNGVVGKQDFINGLKKIGIQDPLLLEQLFSAFDSNKDGTINFSEFVTGLSIVQRGTFEEKLKFMFNAFDLDGNGYLSRDEVFNLLRATFLSKGQFVTPERLKEMVENCFKVVDINHDNLISFEEFQNSNELVKLVSETFVNLPVESLGLEG